MINLENITKRYGEKTVFENFSLSLQTGAVTAILGSSGSGKTTLLNILAGLTDFEGEITGETRPAACVFQTNGLAKNLTVKENILLVNKNADAEGLLSRAGLLGAANLYPKELSGGMARRVALLRAFAYPAKLLLLDEPFFGFDPALKELMIAELERLLKEDSRTTVLVTHEAKEAVRLASRAVIISGGKAVYDKSRLTPADENELYMKLVETGLSDFNRG